ncbi:MAG: outer membrane protein transport protein [Bacteroidetes bacterium]|nr:outer membrane protein transport protein [Bacteroidota bacterium]
MKKLFFSFCLLLTANCQLVFAGGFQVNLQGQKQMGMGHTGTGLLLDGASLLFNPGATSFLDSIRLVQIGASFIIPRTVYLEPAPGIYSTEMVHHVGTPFSVYAVGKIKKADKLNFGLAIYTPFGSREEWPSDWKGQFLLREIDLKAIFFQPTLSYKINDKLGVGAGFVFAKGDFSLSQGVPIQDTMGKYGSASLQGSANGYGYNAGIYFKPNEKFSVGLDYRSSVKLKMENGTADFNVASALADSFPSTTFVATLTLPSTTTFGFGYVLNEKIKLALDINYIGWGVYDTLSFDFADNTELLKDVHSARMYKNTFIVRAGAQYHLKENIFLRGGAYFDKTPVQDGYLTPETPDANRIGLTAGASWRINKKLNLDFSLLYIEGMKRTDTNIEKDFSGTYKARAVAPGFAIEYLF